MRNKTEQLNQLFKEWEKAIKVKPNNLILDGIIDEETYNIQLAFKYWLINRIKYTEQ